MNSKSSKQRIVCATDFSANAARAADVAAAVARQLSATLVLVHVADQPHAHEKGSKELRSYLRPFKEQIEKEALRLRGSGASVEPLVLHGQWAEDAIVDYVEKESPALVVVSSVSKTAFDRWTLGSVSERISQRAPVPTLVVRSPERLLAWATRQRSLNLVVGVDFTVSSDAALAWVRELRKIGPCAVTVAHVNWPPDEQRWLPPGARVALIGNPPRVRQRLLRDLRRKIEGVVEEPVEFQVEPNWGRPDAALVRLATAADADLLVVGAHQRNGVKRVARVSTSRGILRHAPMSVACVPMTNDFAHGLRHRPRVRRVLVATDFSPAGDQAVAWAYAMLPVGGVVKLVHVLPPWEQPSPLIPRFGPKRTTRVDHRRQLLGLRDRLAALVPPDAAAAGVTSEVEVIEDRDAARGIGVAARAFGPDAICLGTHGRAAVTEALIGSVARAVAAQNSQPVLLVRPLPV